MVLGLALCGDGAFGAWAGAASKWRWGHIASSLDATFPGGIHRGDDSVGGTHKGG